MPTQEQIELARNYLITKENILKQAIIVTEDILEHVGDYYKQNELQRKRQELLKELQNTDARFLPHLQGLEFTEEAMENIMILADHLWQLDDKITDKMKESRSAFQEALRKAGQEIKEE